MKVIYYTDSQVTGGAEKYLILLVTNLPKEIKPYVVCHKKQEDLIKRLQEEKIKHFPIAAPSKIFIWQIIPLFRLFKKIKPKVIHFQFWSPYSSFFGLLAARMAKIEKIISTEHSLVPIKEAKIYEIPFKKMYLTYRNNTTNVLITPSRASKKVMIESHKFSKNKIKVIHNFLKNKPSSNQNNALMKRHLENIKEMKEKGFGVVGTVARLEKGKGHLPYLKTVQKILKKCPQTIFVFVGGGSLEKKLKAKSYKLKANKNIIFAGEQKNVIPFLRLFNVFSFPSLSENLPYAILEAERESLPIVAFGVGGIPEQVENKKNGFLVPLGDFDLFAQKIINLLVSTKERETMSRKSREIFKKKFNLKKFLKKTIKVYKNA